MNYKQFSIITVCLNAGDHLSKTVDSVLQQSSNDYEYIIKDGGSTDKSIEKVKEDQRIQIIVKKDNGIYDAMNQAITYASGKYILFLNAGDVLCNPKVLAEVSDAIKSASEPNLLYTDFMLSDAVGQICQQYPRLTEFIMCRIVLCHPTCYFHHRCFSTKKPFDTRYPVVADYNFLLQTWRRPNFRAIYLPIPSVIYDTNGFSSKPENQKHILRNIHKLRRNYFSFKKRILYGIFYSCTLPRLRRKILQFPHTHFLRRLYVFIRNALYSTRFEKQKDQRNQF